MPRLDPRPGLRLALGIFKAGALTHVIIQYGYSVTPISGPSMLPTLDIMGQWVLTSSLHRHGRGVGVGDLVTYDIPISADCGLKRVVGMPGDYVVAHLPGTVPEDRDELLQVPQGHCWLVGDNLAVSRDSRQYGPIPLALVRGKVLATLFPFKWMENPLKKVDPNNDPPSSPSFSD
ncbi:related to IMP1 Protease, mitochondrial [Cephalotrichum gorgonifer]|uniref:Related to IMP1 Protease, mitochondrial n=1 Tax=Cephalotrichum gorgonifer TaxID=2041049 RepID=A0AAE8N752_9PEZI|nr:related to IMP1 Protease, mitochondrial [Cephalotrichum gorgonifer]